MSVMAIIRFTQEDVQRARDPSKSGLTNLRLEEAPDCIGEDCGERIFLSTGDQEKYGRPTSQQRMKLHYHIVLSGDNPPAGPWSYAVFTE